jgi:hypothetical protein
MLGIDRIKLAGGVALLEQLATWRDFLEVWLEANDTDSSFLEVVRYILLYNPEEKVKALQDELDRLRQAMTTIKDWDSQDNGWSCEEIEYPKILKYAELVLDGKDLDTAKKGSDG